MTALKALKVPIEERCIIGSDELFVEVFKTTANYYYPDGTNIEYLLEEENVHILYRFFLKFK